MAGLWSRVTGSGKKTLPADLKRITHSEVLDIPKDLLTPVVEASVNEDDRVEIMKHLRECLAEPVGKHWRRIYGGLVLAEALVKSGSKALVTETAEGCHFDLVQRLSFLENFENTDKRVMNSIRKKAEALRGEVIPLLQNSGTKDAEDCKDDASTCSPGAVSTATHSSSFSSSDEFRTEAPQRTMILNNIVMVGHSDDTTSESEGGDDVARAVRYREPRKMTSKARNERSRRGQVNSSAPAPQSNPAMYWASDLRQTDLLGL